MCYVVKTIVIMKVNLFFSHCASNLEKKRDLKYVCL